MRTKSFQSTTVPSTPSTRQAIQDGKCEPATVMSGPGRQPAKAVPAATITAPPARQPAERAAHRCVGPAVTPPYRSARRGDVDAPSPVPEPRLASQATIGPKLKSPK